MMVEMNQSRDASGVPGDGDELEEDSTPWHFKLMMIVLVLYLLWRGYQLVEWAIHQLF